MVTTRPPGCMHLWDREKIPSMRSSGYLDEWWTTREHLFWSMYEEERW